jgi:endonuclease/exonuclease/phosphatase family metal-dependent hydrolase
VIVGTWNLENLFRPEDDGGTDDAQVYEQKLDGLARVIGETNVDVLAVQEVGDPAALEDLRRRLPGGWHAATSTVFEPRRPIRVGFLSRLALHDVEDVRDFPPKLAPVQVGDDDTVTAMMGRGALRVRVHSDGHDVDLVACHLKSKLLTFPRGRFSTNDEDLRARFAAYALNRRTAEAVTVRTYASTLLDGKGDERAVIVMGDLNDEPEAATTQILLGPPGSEIGTNGFATPDHGDGSRLWNLAPLINLRPGEQPDPAQAHPSAFSRIFHGRGELIDHILVSRKLVRCVDHVATGPGKPPSITEDPAVRKDAPASDHLPVVATFTLP